MEKPSCRAPYFSMEEQTMILEKYEELKHVIQARSNTAATAKARKECWQKVADSVNACNPGGARRTWEQVKNKYKNIVQSAHRKKCNLKKTGGGPPAQGYTPAEELALANNEGRPLMEGVEGGVTSDPGGGSSSHSTAFVQVDSETLELALLPPPTRTLSCTEVEAINEDTVSVYSDRPSLEEATPPEPEPVASTSRQATRQSRHVGADSVRGLYKRTLELDIEYKKLQIKIAKLELEKLENEKKEREKRNTN